MRLSQAGVAAVLEEAIQAARREGQLRELGELAETAGFRRRLRGRIGSWTRAERHPRLSPPKSDSPISREEWGIFGRYRELLRSIGAEDDEGLARWASLALQRHPTKSWEHLERVTVFDPSPGSQAIWRTLETLNQRAESLLVTLPWDPDPARFEAFSSTAPLREKLLDWGFQELAFSAESTRPEGLLGVERELFRDELPGRRLLDSPEGLMALGAPRGEGMGLVIARAVQDRLDEGIAPDDILILFPQWDDQAAVVAETLDSWGIPTASLEKTRLACSPAVSALRRALDLPLEDWEANSIIHLLRNGQLRPSWPGVSQGDLPATATAIRETRVFRGLEAIRNALLRASANVEEGRTDEDRKRKERKAERARLALKVIDRLGTRLSSFNSPAPWHVQVERVWSVRDELGIGTGEHSSSSDQTAVDVLLLALEEQEKVLEWFGQGEKPWSWSAFVHRLDRLVRDLEIPSPSRPGGAVRLGRVGRLDGARAGHLMLANLAESTFPARDAIENEEEAPHPDGVHPGLAREMLRFLRVVGSAEESLTLIYPTADEKGQKLLPAGFLEDVSRLFPEPVWASCLSSFTRLDPILKEELAGSPHEARVSAVAWAVLDHKTDRLVELARRPEHHDALEGTAAALHVSSERGPNHKNFGPFDGRLHSPEIIRRVADSFGPGRPAFSPSQLESLSLCPFQFYLRYVLHLEPIDEREELEEDYTARGSVMHRALETLHITLRDTPCEDGVTLAERVAREISAVVERLLDQDTESMSGVEGGLHQIEAERLRKTGRRYAGQFAAYHAREGETTECHRFEVTFGKPGENEYPPLVVGHDGDAVQLQGMIDRIDLIRMPEATLFRVIDYKTGSAPGPSEVKSGLALQLPLYALAVERIILAEQGALPHDAGYWALAGDGYKSLRLKMAQLNDSTATLSEDWETFRQALETYVVELVSQLRRATFPVHPRKDDCTRFCDYRAVCRIAQVRASRKRWTDAPTLEIPSS